MAVLKETDLVNKEEIIEFKLSLRKLCSEDFRFTGTTEEENGVGIRANKFQKSFSTSSMVIWISYS